MTPMIPALIAAFLGATPAAATEADHPTLVAARDRAQAPSSRGGERATASRRLAEAVEYLRKGKTTAAAGMLELIGNGPPVPGVSDEALFRLALLSLRPGEKGAPALGERLLRQLKKEYPGSPWTVQAEPLMGLLNDSDELRGQNRNLRSANQSLAAERDELKKKVGELEAKIQQLNRNLEQLKHLDLELEQRTR